MKKNAAGLGLIVFFLLASCVSIVPPAEKPPAKRIVGYVTSWSIYGRSYRIQDAPPQVLSHLHYAFATIDADFKISLLDPAADVQRVLGPEPEGLSFHGNFAQLAWLKSINPALRVLITLGGNAEQAKRFAVIAADPELRSRLAASVPIFLETYGFDGLDLDWEYPGIADTENLYALVKELRSQLQIARPEGPAFLLSMAVGASIARLSSLDLPKLSPLLDYINLMAYDFHGPWDRTTGHHTALYPDPLDPGVRSGWVSARYNIDDAVRYCVEAGLSPNKLVLGVPLYGRAWFVADSGSEDGRFAEAAKERPPGTWKTGTYDFDHLRQMANENQFMVYHDVNSQTTWSYDVPTGLFVSWDDEWSLERKLEFVKTKGLGGVAFWELSADRQATQVRAAAEELLGMP